MCVCLCVCECVCVCQCVCLCVCDWGSQNCEGTVCLCHMLTGSINGLPIKKIYCV